MTKQAWRRLVQCPVAEYRRHLLCECLDMYAPLDQVQREELEKGLVQESKAGVFAMPMGLLDKWKQIGLEEGRQVGRQEGRQEALAAWRAGVLKQMNIKFGPLLPEVRERVGTLSMEELSEFTAQLVNAQSLADLGFTDPHSPTL